jgi:hypothetical protein
VRRYAHFCTVDPAYGGVSSSDDDSNVANSVSVSWSSADDTSDSIRDISSYGTAGSEPREGSGESKTSWTALTSLIMRQSRAQQMSEDRTFLNQAVGGRLASKCIQHFFLEAAAAHELRPTRLSVHGWIRRCLKLHSKRFANHHSFLLLGFDYLATERARNSLYYKLSIRKTALCAGAVSAAVVKASIDPSPIMGSTPTRLPAPIPSEISEILNVRRGLYACEGAHFGSNADALKRVMIYLDTSSASGLFKFSSPCRRTRLELLLLGISRDIPYIAFRKTSLEVVSFRRGSNVLVIEQSLNNPTTHCILQ